MYKIIIVVAVLFVSSCNKYNNTKNQNFITKPLVFSKEVLIKDRLNQEQWLNDKLSAPIVFGVQGQRLTREITALSAGASINADPTQNEEYRARQDLDVDSVNRLNELLDLDQETQITRAEQEKILAVERANNEKKIEKLRIDQAQNSFDNLKKRISELESAVSEVCPGDGCDEARNALISALAEADDISSLPETSNLESPKFNGISGAAGTTSNPGDSANDLNSPDFAESFNKIGQALEQTANTLKTTSEALKIDDTQFNRADGLSVTPIDQFEDELAVRARIREEISKNSLDENHDRYDNRLYRFQHRVSILPPDETHDWAKIEVTVRPLSSVLYPAPYHQRVAQFSELIKEHKLTTDDEFEYYFDPEKFPNRNSIDSNTQDQDNSQFTVFRLSQYLEKVNPDLPRAYSLWTDEMKAEMETKLNVLLRNLVEDLKYSTDSNTQKKVNRLTAQIDKEAALICYQYFDQPGFSSKPKRPTNNVFFDSRFSIQPSGLLDQFMALCSSGTRPERYDTFEKIQKRVDEKDELGALLNNLVLLRHAFEELTKEYNILPYLNLFIEEVPTVAGLPKFYFNWKKLPTEVRNNAPTDCFKALNWLDYITWRQNLKDKTASKKFCIPAVLGTKQSNMSSAQEIDYESTFNYGTYLLLANILSIPESKVYTTTPSESAQRIKDIAESSNVINLNLAAQFLAGSVGGEAFVNYLRAKEKLLTNILRKPLVIGLAGEQVPPTKDGKPAGIKYGWIFGPIFRISDDRQNSEFIQTATNKVVSADISLPSYVNGVEMEANLSWLDNNSLREIERISAPIATSKNPQLVPTDGIEISNLFLSNNRNRIHRTADPNFELPTNLSSSGNIIIEADNVWRATHVSIGNKIFELGQNNVFGGQKALKFRYSGLDKTDCETLIKIKESEVCEAKIRIWSDYSDVYIVDDRLTFILNKEARAEAPTAPLKLSVVSLKPNEKFEVAENKKNIDETIVIKLNDFHDDIKNDKEIKFGYKLSQSSKITAIEKKDNTVNVNLKITDAWNNFGCGDITKFAVGATCSTQYEYKTDAVKFSGNFELIKAKD